jgi:RNA polymerase primary sigma factor
VKRTRQGTRFNRLIEEPLLAAKISNISQVKPMTTSVATYDQTTTILSAANHDKLRQRAHRLARTEIPFIASEAFVHVDGEMEQSILREVESWDAERGDTARPGQTGDWGRLGDTDPLTPDAEREMFFRMNYLKFRANSLRLQFDPDRATLAEVQRIERLVDGARLVRDRIVTANTRLVMAIVKKMVSPRHSFDDLLSEGMWLLIRVVDKFDYNRGFRFSTYGYRSIARHVNRYLANQQRHATRYLHAEDRLLESEDDGRSATAAERECQELNERLRKLIKQLDRRDQFIIRCRFALGGHRKTKTCQFLADKLGISKERVRQLEHRAIRKLRHMTGELSSPDLAELLGN